MSAKSPNRFQSLTCVAVAGLALLGGPTVRAADDPKPSAPVAKSKWILPKYYDELGLTDDQKARVTRVAETLNPKINKSKALLRAYNRNPLANGIAAAQMSQLLRKLVHERQKQLDEILTEDQRKKLRELSGDNKSVPKSAASNGPKKPLEADNKGPEPTECGPTGRAADEPKPLATAKHPLGVTVEVLEVSIDDTQEKLKVVWRYNNPTKKAIRIVDASPAAGRLADSPFFKFYKEVNYRSGKLDDAEAVVYSVVKTVDGKKLDATNFSRTGIVVPAEGSFEMYAKFPKPIDNSGKIHLQLPSLPQLENLPIATKKIKD